MINLYNNKSITNLIVKVASNSCNINCLYCFEKAKHIPNGILAEDLLDKVINSIIGKLSLTFHGGEPLFIGLEKFDSLLNLLKKYYPDKVVAIRVQTNGTLLNNDWIDLLFNIYKDLNIEIAISLDGPKQMNFLRVDYKNNNTFDRVLNSYRLLEKNNIKAGLLSVISKNSLSFYKEYIEFLSSIKNISFVKLNPLFNLTKDNQLDIYSITPMEYANFMVNIAKYYIKFKLYNEFAIEPILSIFQQLSNVKSKYCNYNCNKCFNHICIYPSGIVSPCDCLSLNDYSICNINNIDDNINVNIQKYLSENENVEILRNLINKCYNCDIYKFCLAGCLSQRYFFRKNDYLSNNFCESKHYLYDVFKNLLFNRRFI